MKQAIKFNGVKFNLGKLSAEYVSIFAPVGSDSAVVDRKQATPTAAVSLQMKSKNDAMQFAFKLRHKNDDVFP